VVVKFGVSALSAFAGACADVVVGILKFIAQDIAPLMALEDLIYKLMLENMKTPTSKIGGNIAANPNIEIHMDSAETS
jgi:hypothetical protein